MIFSRSGLRKMNRTKPHVKVKGIDGWLQWDLCNLDDNTNPIYFRAMPPQGFDGNGALYFINNIYMKKPNTFTVD